MLMFVVASTACGGGGNQNSATSNVSRENANPANAAKTTETPQTPLESELARLQRANFRQIIAFSRKDAGKLTDEDKAYFRQYAPSEQINQRLITGDSKYFVAGTNFVFLPEQIEALNKRFVVEDFTEKYGRKIEPTPKKSN